MVTKRIIPCLDVFQGKTVKGINFINLKEIGNPVEMGQYYSNEGADELVYLDISATQEGRKTFVSLVKQVADKLKIPFTVGGGISTLQDAAILLDSGADKVSINSSALSNPSIIEKIASLYGSQFVVVAIDAKLEDGIWRVKSRGGTKESGYELFEWASQAQERGAGEILFTSINHDGTKKGFALDALAKLNSILSIPVIASGGAGTMEHFKEVFENGHVSAALAASVFHNKEILIRDLKNYLISNKIEVRI
ncbi:MAG: imidazole glycerol phosphate synthase subunit HisF [Bacteroidales bacterium]|nr:imidazole glycerol phosphate synthase subunit HisF [Bacteroidales bacterium]MDD4657182.1 imidazole glycerol phosphate synthase subunit HisF [Bacteroidales bacterium]